MHLLDFFRPGRAVYLPGASGESRGLVSVLNSEPGRLCDVEIVSCFLPGINEFDYAALDPKASITTFMLPPVMRPSFDGGRVKVVPIAYSAIARYLSSRTQLDVAVAHVAPPNSEGRCSLGVAADFSSIAWRNARQRILLVNPLMPSMRRGPSLPVAEADALFTIESAVIEAAPVKVTADLLRIADYAASYVPDGASIQLGLGGAPGALWTKLASHRDLVIASGMVADGVQSLYQAGALRDGGAHRAGVALGSTEFYHWLAETDLVGFATTAETHDLTSLAGTERFTALNSAFEVDLFGQANLEWQSGRQSGGVGGAPDFARAAVLSPGGRSVIMLPATAKAGAISRITPRLSVPTISVPRTDIDTVVTEHGAADLRGLSQDERAQALIAIAAPDWREQLDKKWFDIRRSL